MKPTLVTCFINPDLDGYACVVAYTEFLQKIGKMAEAGIFGNPRDEVQFILHRFNLEVSSSILIHHPKDFEYIILVDANSMIRLDKRLNPERVIEIIDNKNIDNIHMFPKAAFQIERVGAVATLIGERFEERGLAISTRSAILLYAAILSQTLNLTSHTTTERDRTCADWLNRTARLSPMLAWEIFLAKSDLTGGKLAMRIAEGYSSFYYKDKLAAIVQIELIGAETLVATRQKEMLTELTRLKARLRLEMICLVVIDLEAKMTFFVTEDQKLQDLLSRLFLLNFVEGNARVNELLMAKDVREALQKEAKKKAVFDDESI